MGLPTEDGVYIHVTQSVLKLHMPDLKMPDIKDYGGDMTPEELFESYDKSNFVSKEKSLKGGTAQPVKGKGDGSGDGEKTTIASQWYLVTNGTRTREKAIALPTLAQAAGWNADASSAVARFKQNAAALWKAFEGHEVTEERNEKLVQAINAYSTVAYKVRTQLMQVSHSPQFAGQKPGPGGLFYTTRTIRSMYSDTWWSSELLETTARMLADPEIKLDGRTSYARLAYGRSKSGRYGIVNSSLPRDDAVAGLAALANRILAQCKLE